MLPVSEHATWIVFSQVTAYGHASFYLPFTQFFNLCFLNQSRVTNYTFQDFYCVQMFIVRFAFRNLPTNA